jgi:hypothetical protein
MSNTEKAKMIRLNDVLPVNEPPEFNTLRSNPVTNITELSSAIKSLRKVNASGILELVKQHSEQRIKLLGYAVPKNQRSGFTIYGNPENDSLTLAFNSPTIESGALIELSGRAGLAIIPAESASSIAWKDSPGDEVYLFRKLPLPIWLVCPVSYFDPSKWVYAQSTMPEPILPGYASLLSPILTLLREIILEQRKLNDRVSRVERRLSSLEHQMVAMEIKLSEERAVRIQQESEIAAQSRRIRLEDPLLIAGDMFSEDAGKRLIVGPCWGPPLDERILKALLSE